MSPLNKLVINLKILPKLGHIITTLVIAVLSR